MAESSVWIGEPGFLLGEPLVFCRDEERDGPGTEEQFTAEEDGNRETFSLRIQKPR